MKKLKKSVKIILTISVSLVCVTAIVLGCIFGFKKPGEEPPTTPPPTGFSQAQKDLAAEINSNVKQMTYEVTDVPYASLCDLDDLTRFGSNYFAFTNEAGNEDFCTYYWDEENEEYVVLKLTDLNKHYGFLKPDHKSFAIEKLVENYVLFATYFEDEAYNKDYQKIYYSLVYFGNPEEPIEIFGFDTRETPMHVNQDGFVVEDDYFAFSYIDNFDMVNLIADYNVYFYPHSTTSISYKVDNENNYIKTSYTEDNAYGISKFYNNSFYVKSETGFNFYYLSGNEFKTISKTESYFDENLKTTYDFSEISKNKILISKIDYVLNQSEIKPSTILLNTFENGVKIYANYSYSILDVNLSLEKPLMVPDNYAKAVVNKNMSENLTNSYVVNFQKVDADGNLKQEFLTSYYNSNGEIVVNFTTTVPNEKILFAGTKTFLTKNQIFENDNSVLGKTKVVFDATTYTLANTDLINQSVFAITCNNNVGLMNIDGEILYNPENSQYSHFYNISGDTCYAYEKVFNKVYLLNYKTGSATLIEDLTTNTLLLANDIDLNILKNVENKNKITYDLKTLDNVLKVENITEFKNSKVLGDAFIEIYISSLQPVKLIQIKEKDKVDVNSYQVSLNVSDVEYQETAETYEGVTSQVLHASNPHIYDDPGYDTGNCTISQSENPTLTITMIDGYAMSDMSGYIYYGDGDYFIEAYHSFYFGGVNDSYFSCDFDGTWHTAMTFSFNSSRQLVYTARVSYVNKWWSWFKWHSDYSSVGINLWSDACSPVEHEVYFYGLWSNETNENSAQYSSTVNQVNLFDDHFYNEETTEKMWSKTIKYCDVSGNVYFPRVEDVYLRYGKLSSWRCFGYWEAFNSYVKQNTYAPSDYTDSNTISGSSSSFAQTHTPGYYTNETVNDNLASYYYASYSENQYTLTVDGTAHTYGATKTTDVFNYGPEKTGYTWIGYQVTGAGENQTPIVTYVNSAGTVLGTKKFEDHDGTFSFYFSDFDGTTGVYLQWLADADGSAVTMTSLYKAIVYTITLDTQNGSGGTSLIYVHYSVGVYLNCDLSGPTVSNQMTTSANPITCPTRTGYIFAGYYTTQNSGGTQYIDSSGKVTSDFSTTYFTAAGTLYARWTAITYTVRYDTSATTNTTLVATYDIEFNIPAPTTKQFHYFSGWSVSGVCGTVYAGTSSSTLTALDHTANSPTSTGSFGPTTNNYFKNLTYSNGATVTITSNWTGNEYTVSFDPSGGRVNNAATYSFTANYGVEANLPSITKSGYTFTGWMVSGMDEETTHEFIGTTTNSITTATADLENVYTKFKSLRGSAGTVNFVAKWRANTYSVTYDLTTGSWAGTEVHPTGATYDIPLYVDNVSEDGWPFGYYFNGWTITDMAGTPLGGTSTSNMTNANVSSGTTTASIKYFKNLTNVDGGTVKLTARWQPYSYNIQYVANGANVTLNSSNPASANYDETVTINDPTRIGYSFAGWSVSGLSDEIPHTANGTTFNSINGTYTNASNPNKLIFFKGSSTTCTFKNLHYVQGATVVLTANWTPAVYTITYHYADDSLFSSHPSLSTVNTSSNMTLTKTQSITYTHYFTTYAVSNLSTEPNAVAVPSGYKMVGWFLRSTTVTNSNVANLSSSYRVAVNTEYLNDYAFQTAHSTNSTVDGNLHAYAVYEAVTFTLKFYAPETSEGLNNLANYSEVHSMQVGYGSAVTLDNYGEVQFSSYMISPNLYVDGDLKTSYTSFTYNGVTYTSNVGYEILWGISNTLARNPNNPIFYLYGEFDSDYGGTLDKLTFTYNSTTKSYTVKAKNTSISGRVVIPKRYISTTYGDYPVADFASNAFKNCTAITSVSIGGNITTVLDNTFYGCTALETANLPDSISAINTYAFYNCTSLTNVNIPEGVSSIGSYAFYKTALTSIVFPESLSSIGSNSFSSCSKLVISKIDCDTIGSGAFSSCVSIESITLKCKEIGGGAFSSCSKLSSVVLEEGIEVLGSTIFENSLLTSLHIPSTVTSINYQLFYTTMKDNITSLTVSEDNSVYDSRDNCNAIIETASNRIVLACKNTVIPSSIESIGSFSFSCIYSLTEIELTSNIVEILSYAFYKCSSLVKLIVPSSVSAIQGSTFKSCSAMEYIYIPSSVTSISGSSYTSSPFESCSETMIIYCGLTSKPSGWGSYWNYYAQYYTLDVIWDVAESEVEFIHNLPNLYPQFTFEGATITGYSGTDVDLVIPMGIKKIASSVFDNNKTIKTVTIPSSVQTIGSNTFYGCTALESVYIESGKIESKAFYDCPKLTSVVLCESVTSIANAAFGYCDSLYTVTIPSTVTSMTTPFTGCYKLVQVRNLSGLTLTLPENEDMELITTTASFSGKLEKTGNYVIYTYGSSKHLMGLIDTTIADMSDIPSGVTSVYTRCLYYVQDATYNVVLPNTVTTISDMSFYYSTIEKITLSSALSYIGEDSFWNCSSLTTVTTPSTMTATQTTFGESIFEGCSVLTSFTVPKTVTEISARAFASCTALTSVTIPEGVTSIGSSAFYYTGITSITLPSTLTTLGSSVFFYSKLTSITIPKSVTSFGTSLFQGCSDLTSATISCAMPDNTLPESTFQDCTSLTTFKSSVNINTIGKRAFSGCTSFINYSITSITKTIGDYAFADSGLTSLTIPSNIQSIGSEAFAGTKITSINVPSTVTTWGTYVFSGCENLKSAYILSGNTIIPQGMFHDCVSLITVSIASTVTEFGSSCFSGAGFTAFTVPDSVTTFGTSVFSDCESLQTLELGSGATAIPRNFAYGCSAMTRLYISDSVKSLDYSAFSYCTSLSTVYIPSSVTTIKGLINSGNMPFTYCSSSLKIYCGAGSRPSGWYSYWNYRSTSSTEKYSVYWGYTRASYEQYYASGKPVIPLEMVENQFSNGNADVSYLEYAVMPSELVSNTIKTSSKED